MCKSVGAHWKHAQIQMIALFQVGFQSGALLHLCGKPFFHFLCHCKGMMFSSPDFVSGDQTKFLISDHHVEASLSSAHIERRGLK